VSVFSSIEHFGFAIFRNIAGLALHWLAGKSDHPQTLKRKKEGNSKTVKNGNDPALKKQSKFCKYVLGSDIPHDVY
jgi:hypothetical protein